MQSIVINMGGSVILSDDIDIIFFKKLKNLLIKYSKKYKIYIVVGGGKIARIYIDYGRAQNLGEEILDKIGIDVTRLNAKIFSDILGLSNYTIPFTSEEAKKINKSIVVMGGTVPGHSTDMVGAELAEKVKASKFIIATNVDGVYDKDPNKYKNAKKFKEINVQALIDKYGTGWNSAGKNVVIDGPALKIIKRAKLHTFVFNGKKLSEFEKVLNNKQFNGTVIKV